MFRKAFKYIQLKIILRSAKKHARALALPALHFSSELGLF
jgi:hypothetical protein